MSDANKKTCELNQNRKFGSPEFIYAFIISIPPPQKKIYFNLSKQRRTIRKRRNQSGPIHSEIKI